jgi:chromate transporter
VLALAALYADFSSDPVVKRVVIGVAAAGAGLFIGTAIKLAKPIARSPAGLAVAAGCFIAVGIGRVSMLIVIPVAALASYLLARNKLI